MHVLLNHLGLAITIAAIASFAGLVAVIVKVAGDEVAGLKSTIATAAPVLGEFLTAVGSILWSIRCWLYTMRWKLRRWSRHKALNTVVGVLLGASIYVVIDVILVVVRTLTESESTDPKGTIVLHPDFPVPHFHLPLWVELSLLGLAVLMVWHHWREWKLRTQNFEIPKVTEGLLLKLDESRSSDTNVCTAEARQAFIDSVINEMKKRLGNNAGKTVVFSLMERTPQDELVTTLFHQPDNWTPGDLTLKVGEGGAGTAFASRSAIYIPSTKHRMGINVDTNKTLGPIYRPEQTPSPRLCLLCIPVFRGGNPIAVLNIGCSKRSAFNSFQINLGKLTAAMISAIR